MSRDHAIVIGGGIAGLLAAHVSKPHFDRVTIFDRDRFPTAPGPRSGVPQGRHLHMLMARGLQAFEDMVPGFGNHLAEAGAQTLDFGADTALYFPAGKMARFPSDIAFRACTRDLLEWVLRQRVMNDGHVQSRSANAVVGLTYDQTTRTITGVQLTDDSVPADLVIDTTGRASTTPAWLQKCGLSEVEETVVEAPIDYASREYRSPGPRDWKLLAVAPQYPEIPRGGTICRVEDGVWNVLLLGIEGESVPTEEDGFLDFARRLAVPVVYEALRNAEPVSAIYRYRNNRNRIRHYERMTDWPHRLVALGDAVCALNPYAGLGMTAAALGVRAFKEALDRASENEGIEFGFQARLAEVNEPAWKIATHQHLRWPPPKSDEIAAARPPLGAYLQGLMQRALRDTDVATAMLKVMHMLEPPAVLFTSEMQRRVMAYADGAETLRGP